MDTRVQLILQFTNQMKKSLFTLLVALLAASQVFSQHEVKVNLGRSYSNSYNFSEFIDSFNTSDYTSSPNKSMQFGVGYAYYLKHNLKLFTDFTFQQKGFESHLINYSGSIVSDQTNVYQFDYLNSTLGVTYVFGMGAYASVGFTSASLRNATLSQDDRFHFETDPLSSYIDNQVYDISQELYSQVAGTTIAIGYQYDDLSFEISRMSLGQYGGNWDGLDSYSFIIGYSKLIIR